jgi:hypothetical protein
LEVAAGWIESILLRSAERFPPNASRRTIPPRISSHFFALDRKSACHNGSMLSILHFRLRYK